jgi:hypothetical protein
MEFANLRPLGVGEILDTAFRIYRTRFKDLVVAVAIPMVPLVVLQILINLSVTRGTTLETQNGVLVQRTGTDAGVAVGAFVATILISLIASAVAQGASIRIVADQYLGSTTSWRESLGYAVPRVGAILWVSILVGLSEVAGLVLCVIPGVYLWAALAVSIPALLIENARGTRALGRSRRLVSGRWLPTFGALFVIFLLTAVIGGLLGAIVGGGSALGGSVTGTTSTRILGGTVSGIVNILVTPLSAAVATIIYFDLRIRKEGFDVALMAQRLGVPPPGPNSWAPPTAPPPGPNSWAPPTAPPPGPNSWAPPTAPPPGPPGWRPAPDPRPLPPLPGDTLLPGSGAPEPAAVWPPEPPGTRDEPPAEPTSGPPEPPPS